MQDKQQGFDFEVPPAAPGGPGAEPSRPWHQRPHMRIVAGVALLLIFLLGWLAFTAPLSRALEPLETPAIVLEAADGSPIARRGSFKAEPVDVKSLPAHVPNAFLSIEDRRFYNHWGVDPLGIARAMLANWRAGGVVEGGSTITQQLAKTSFLSMERSLWRKAQEVIIAIWLEAWLSKDEILSRYLSSVYFGDGAYGIRAASMQYFSKKPENLTIAEAAMLAGLVKAPSRLSPTRDYDAARARGRVVIQAMVENGKLTPAQARNLRRAILKPGRKGLPGGSYFSDWVWEDAALRQQGRFGEVRVRTTLDTRLQKLAERVVTQELNKRAWLGAHQAALVAMQRDGTVVAMVGGRDYKASTFNRVTQAKRQPGSAFKIFVYLAALRDGHKITDMIEDTPLTISDWSPANHENKYRGTISLRSAFAASSNVAAARLANEVGARAIQRTAQDLGVTAEMSDDLTVALGTSDMTLLELTSAFAAVAEGRYPIVAHGLRGIKPDVTQRRLKEREDMEQLLLSAVRNGTGSTARLPIAAYGKTGTTQDYRDAIFVGYAGDLVVGVWVGNDDNKPMNGVTGAGLPAYIWKSFMLGALPELQNRVEEPQFDAEKALQGIDEALGQITTGGTNGSDALGDLISSTLGTLTPEEAPPAPPAPAP